MLVHSLFPLGRPSAGSRPPLASFAGFRSRIWTLLFVFGFFSIFGCWFISDIPSVDSCCLGCACSQVYCPKSGARLCGKLGFFTEGSGDSIWLQRPKDGLCTEPQPLMDANEHQFIRISVDSCGFVVSLTSARGRRRFFRSGDHHAMGPKTALPSANHS